MFKIECRSEIVNVLIASVTFYSYSEVKHLGMNTKYP